MPRLWSKSSKTTPARWPALFTALSTCRGLRSSARSRRPTASKRDPSACGCARPSATAGTRGRPGPRPARGRGCCGSPVRATVAVTSRGPRQAHLEGFDLHTNVLPRTCGFLRKRQAVVARAGASGIFKRESITHLTGRGQTHEFSHRTSDGDAGRGSDALDCCLFQHHPAEQQQHVQGRGRDVLAGDVPAGWQPSHCAEDVRGSRRHVLRGRGLL